VARIGAFPLVLPLMRIIYKVFLIFTDNKEEDTGDYITTKCILLIRERILTYLTIIVMFKGPMKKREECSHRG
jgi:hypothetical protein